MLKKTWWRVTPESSEHGEDDRAPDMLPLHTLATNASDAAMQYGEDTAGPGCPMVVSVIELEGETGDVAKAGALSQRFRIEPYRVTRWHAEPLA